MYAGGHTIASGSQYAAKVLIVPGYRHPPLNALVPILCNLRSSKKTVGPGTLSTIVETKMPAYQMKTDLQSGLI